MIHTGEITTPEGCLQYSKENPFHGLGRATIWFRDRAKQRIVTKGMSDLGYLHTVFMGKDQYHAKA